MQVCATEGTEGKMVHEGFSNEHERVWIPLEH